MVVADKRIQDRHAGMMSRVELQRLIDYHYWATYRIIDAVELLSPEQFTRDLGNSFPSVRDTLVHLFGAEWVWLSRWNGVSPSALLPNEMFPDPATARKKFVEHEVIFRDFWRRTDESRLGETIGYRTLSGQEFESKLWQMLVHVINHGTYHRGQLTTMLRQLGAAAPKATDLIVYYRENPS
jgi:uncharacterized damage-inducible protein DinB